MGRLSAIFKRAVDRNGISHMDLVQEPDGMLTTKQFSQEYGFSFDSVYGMMKRGKVRFVRIGGRWRTFRRWVERWNM